MNEPSKKGIKYLELYPSLNGLDLAVEELDLPVPVYNFLNRNGIHTVQSLLDVSEDDLMKIKTLSGRQDKFIEVISYKLCQLVEEKIQ